MLQTKCRKFGKKWLIIYILIILIINESIKRFWLVIKWKKNTKKWKLIYDIISIPKEKLIAEIEKDFE